MRWIMSSVARKTPYLKRSECKHIDELSALVAGRECRNRSNQLRDEQNAGAPTVTIVHS